VDIEAVYNLLTLSLTLFPGGSAFHSEVSIDIINVTGTPITKHAIKKVWGNGPNQNSLGNLVSVLGVDTRNQTPSFKSCA